MGLFKKEIAVVEKPQNKKLIIKLKSLIEYGAIEETDEHNTLTVKQPVVVNKKTQT